TTSITRSRSDGVSACTGLTRPTRYLRSKTFTRPRREPNSSAVPVDGNSRLAATWSSVVLPAPFGPSTTHRSPAETAQLTPESRTDPSRTTVTSSRRNTAAGMGLTVPLRLPPTDHLVAGFTPYGSPTDRFAAGSPR